MKKLINVLKHPIIYYRILFNRICMKMEDEKFLKILYKRKFHKKLNLDNPITYNEKLQWLKLNDRNPIYTKIVDKYAVKSYVADKIGSEYIIENIALYDSVKEIVWDKLPNEFVLKCTHDSGGLILCKDKSSLNIEKAKAKLNKSMENNYFYLGREWPYKNVEKKIIAERFMMDESGYELKDYKFFCFNGEVKCLFVAKDRLEGKEVTFDFFDRVFNHLSIEQGHKNAKTLIEKPINFEKMIELAEKLSVGIPQVRVDFYNCNGKIYFGEMTLYHFSGLVPFTPNEWDEKFGNWIDLSKAYCYKEQI